MINFVMPRVDVYNLIAHGPKLSNPSHPIKCPLPPYLPLSHV